MSLAVAYAMKKRAKKMSSGGMAEPMPMEHGNEDDADMITRIMAKRKSYSEGGMVANDVGVAEADKLPAEYDDLVLRDDLEMSYDGANSGDELGNAQKEEDERDVVSKIMASRKKKDRMPRPA